jgi:hypothetical protein
LSSAESRLAAVAGALEGLGLRALIMGGHAVCFYGVDRSTLDYDFVAALGAAEWSSLGDRLSQAPLFAAAGVREGASWRPHSFRRFVIGALPDGREERLEVWRRNHLLAPFDDLWARRTEGEYGGRPSSFLGLDDLIRSKETEREDDWRDVALLEEIADEGRLGADTGPSATVHALSRLRSRRGLEQAIRSGRLSDPAEVARALAVATHPISQAYLLPFARRSDQPSELHRLLLPLRTALFEARPGSDRHLAVVEAARRLYRREAMEADRADKEREATVAPEE